MQADPRDPQFMHAMFGTNDKLDEQLYTASGVYCDETACHLQQSQGQVDAAQQQEVQQYGAQLEAEKGGKRK